MKTLSSIVTPSQMNVWLEILQRFPTLAFFWISTKAPILVSSPTSHPYRLINWDNLTPWPSFTSAAIHTFGFIAGNSLSASFLGYFHQIAQSVAIRRKQLQSLNVVILWVVPIAEVLHVLDQILHDALDAVVGMKAERVLGLLNTHLVVPEILLVVDGQTDRNAELCLNRHLPQIAHFAHRIISGSNVKESGDPLAGLDRADVGVCGVLDADNGPPDRWIVHRNFAVAHAVLKHSVDD